MRNDERPQYEAAICQHLPSARVVEFRKLSMGDWVPLVSECHKNVDKWVQEHPSHRAVKGWVAYKQCVLGENLGWELAAHSVVCDENGDLFDITPIQDERLRHRCTSYRT